MVKKNGIVGISLEDTQALLQQLRRFQENIGRDWKSVIDKWQNLEHCWQDRQYDRFEPFFEQLSQTYNQCEQKCEEYAQFLEKLIPITAQDQFINSTINDTAGLMVISLASNDPPITALGVPVTAQDQFINSAINATASLVAIGLASNEPTITAVGATSLLTFLKGLGGGHKYKYRQERQIFLRSLADDPKAPKHVREWIKQEQKRIWNIQKLKATKKLKEAVQNAKKSEQTLRKSDEIKGVPGYDVGHRFPQVDLASTFRLEIAADNRGRPGRAKRLGLSESHR